MCERETQGGGSQWMEGADGYGTKDKEIGIASESMSIYGFFSRSAITHIISHSFMSAVPMATYSVFLQEAVEPVTVCICVFQCVLHFQAGGNINDLYLWQHQQQSHQYTAIRKTVQCPSL